MTAATKAPAAGGQRKGLYAKIGMARKALSIEDDAYRDLLRARYGAGSATELSTGQLEDLLDYFKAQGFKPTRGRRAPARAGGRPLATAPEAKKARALWISLYHLGVVREPTESALAAFAKRQLGIEALQWVKGDWHRVIEALKDWGAREAGVDWSGYKRWTASGVTTVYCPRARVMEAQWRLLAHRGVVGIRDLNALSSWAARYCGIPRAISHAQLEDADADKVIEALGAKVRASAPDGDTGS